MNQRKLIVGNWKMNGSLAANESLVRELLDLTKDVAHNRSRPAAPLTAFVVGLASKDVEEARANIAKLKEAVQ